MKKIIFIIIILLVSVGIYIIYPIWINPKSPRAKEILQIGNSILNFNIQDLQKEGV